MRHITAQDGTALFGAALLVSALAGCAGTGARGPEPGGVQPPSADAFEAIRVPIRSATGCLLDTRLYSPTHARTAGLVVLAPGFLRDGRHLEDLARTLAARGIPAAVVTPCNSRPWDGRHYRTGLDMGRAARRLATGNAPQTPAGESEMGPDRGGKPTVYGGFSAGGLAALAAARTDPQAVGALGLDLVDAQGLGRLLARGLKAPLRGLAGEPGPCNARGNGLSVYTAAPDGQVERLPGVGHCDFESPTDGLCLAVCGGTGAGSAARRTAIVAAAADAAERLLGLADPAHTQGP